MAKVRKHDATGRSTTPSRFVQIPYYVLQSESARRLSGNAFKVLLYLVMRHNGVNNGRIAFGARSGCFVRKPGTGEIEDSSIGIAPRTVTDALFELDRAGFVRCEKESSFQNDKRIIREWRLTWLPHHGGGEATKDFTSAAGEFRRKKTRPSKRPAALCTDLQSAQPPQVIPETAQIIPYRAPSRSIDQSHRAPSRPHILNHTQSAASEPEIQASAAIKPRAVASKLTGSIDPVSTASAKRGPKDSQRAGAQRGPSAIKESRVGQIALKAQLAKQNAAIDDLIADNREWEAAFDAKHPDYPQSKPYELVSDDPVPDGIMEAIAQQVTAASPARCAA